MAGAPPEVVLYVRADCHLCEHAQDALRRLGRELAFELHKRDVDADPTLAERYGERVPVVTVGGREAGAGRIELAALRRALLEGQGSGAVDSSSGRS